MKITLPANNWKPRPYQFNLWSALKRGCKLLVVVAHRRWGKDEIALNWVAIAAFTRVANYWHMLPEAAQARKAIWDAVNPHTGKKRIDEAFPLELRAATKDHEMMIKFINGSTWQVVGSDNYNSLVGSAPAGVIFSEFSLAKPEAWGYIKPIIRENNGWALFIYTSRGDNHGHDLYKLAKDSDNWFCEKQSVEDTGAVPQEVLAQDLEEYKMLYGEEAGLAFFNQEYYCDFESPVIGAVYGKQMADALKEGRISSDIVYNPNYPVNTSWDFGWSDSTSIWFWQKIGDNINFIDYHEGVAETPEYHAGLLFKKYHRYEHHYVPHDAANKTYQAGGRSIIDQFATLGIRMKIVYATSENNKVVAVRKMFGQFHFNDDTCQKGLRALKNYHYKFVDSKKQQDLVPYHDWSSHACDAIDIVARVFQEEKQIEEKPKPRFLAEMSLDELWQTTPRKDDRI